MFSDPYSTPIFEIKEKIWVKRERVQPSQILLLKSLEYFLVKPRENFAKTRENEVTVLPPTMHGGLREYIKYTWKYLVLYHSPPHQTVISWCKPQLEIP